jgi:glycine C-acetyltransferase
MLRPIRSPDRFAPFTAPSGTSGPGFQDGPASFLQPGALPLSPGVARTGLDFVTQDYLALASHPDIRAAALAALSQPRILRALQSVTLEDRIAGFLGLPRAFVFASGSDAIRATFLRLLRPDDEVLVDAGSHPATSETVLAARSRLHRCPAASIDGMERRLARLARQSRPGRLFMAVPAISAHAGRMADLAELSALARRYSAYLIVDVSHDLGAMGQEGLGVPELQGCLGRIDVVLGSFAKTFAAPGGFAAHRDPSLLAEPHPGEPHWSPLSPVHAAVILAALDLVTGAEGRRRRRRLHGCTLRLRNHLMADGVRVMGQPSPFVPVRLPMQTAVARTRLLESAGPKINLLQAPTVPRHAPRWRIQLNADHGAADIDDLAELIRDVTRVFDRQTRSDPALDPLTQDAPQPPGLTDAVT